MKKEIGAGVLKRFAFLVGGAFAVVGAWPLVFPGRPQRLWAYAIAGFLILLGMVRPQALLPVYRGWMALGRVLSWINTRLLLGFLFYGVLTPMGILRRIFKGDFLHCRLQPEADTYRSLRQPRPGTHMDRQF